MLQMSDSAATMFLAFLLENEKTPNPNVVLKFMMMLLGIGSELPGKFPGSKVPIKDDAVNAMKTDNEVVDKRAELNRKFMSMRPADTYEAPEVSNQKSLPFGARKEHSRL